MITTIAEFYEGAGEYVGSFNTFAQKHGLVGRVQADHLCYKCDSSDVFEAMRAMFEGSSEYMYQSIISKRRIAVIRLKTPIQTILGDIFFIELSDQKPDGSQTNRYDHIEAYPVGWTYDEMVAELAKTEAVEKVDRPHHSTHDIDVGNRFLFRCTHGKLIEKIKTEEMK